MKDRTKDQIIRELVEQADEKYMQDMISGCLPSTADHPIRLAHNSESIGKIVQALPQEDRDKLKDLTTEDIGQQFAAYRRARPQFPTHRKRGPVTHTRSKD